MPTLRIELLKSREEDDTKNLMMEKTKVVHTSRVNMLGGYTPHHATKLKYSVTEPLKQRPKVEKAIINKAVPSAGKKLSKNEIYRSTLQHAYKGRPTPHSPSESDSFSIRSSSSSSKSEASDSTKKPSPPASLMKPSVASLSISLGSYLGAQAIEMWDVHHMPPSDFSKAIHEKLHGESKTLQDCFLEFKFSQGNIVETHVQRLGEGKVSTRCDNSEHIGSGCVRKHGSINVEDNWAHKASTRCDNAEHVGSGRVRKHDSTSGEDDCAHGLATPAFYMATAPSPETSSETTCHSGYTCKASFIGQEIKHTQSIKELMGQHRGSHKETGVLHAGHERPCRMEAQDQVQPERAGQNVGTHVLQSKHDEDFSFEALPIRNDAYMQDISPCRHTSVDRSTYPEVVTDYKKEVSARVSLEKYVFSTPLMGRSVSSIPSHSERDIYLPSPTSLGHCHDVMNTRAEVGTLKTPPVHEIRFKANAEACTPVSPLSLGEDGSYHRFDEFNGIEYADGGTWFTTSKAQLPLHSPSKAHWDWRSRSLGARASLKSAVRNLEAAFGGSRSVSLPKTRSQTQQREMKPESSTFLDRVFVSPAKARQKRAELLKPIQRFSYSGDHIPTQDSTRSRRELHTDDSRGERVGASRHPVLLPLPLSKQHHQSDIPDLKFSNAPFAPTPRSVHRLAHLKRLSGHTSPLSSRPPAFSLHQAKVDTCMLQGYLQCIVRDGFTSYTLSLKDSEEMLLAKACTFAHDSSKDGCKCMYIFHSGKSKSRGKGANGWRSWLKKDSKSTADRAGKMQVSSQVCAEVSPAGKRTQFLVSEFVLYDRRNDDAVRSQSLRFLSSNNACHNTFTPAVSPPSVRSAYELFGQPSAPNYQKQAPDIPKSPSSGRMSLKSVNSNQVQPYSPLSGVAAAHRSSNSIDVWSDSDVTEPDVECLRSYPSLCLELAAIVIKMPMDDSKMDGLFSPTGGACKRSLKFSDDELKGCQQDARDSKSAHGITSNSMVACGTSHGQLLENRATSECVTMMLPKEHHGLPKSGVHGPTSLIERWRCGGKCDCGGWDLGCGMDIFGTQRCENVATAANHGNSIQSLSHNQPLIIYSQGKVREMLLNLSLVQEGYFILKFRSDLSPLKAFAASVAILHSRESSLTIGKLKHTENANNQQCQAISDIADSLPKGYERPALLEVCKEIPTWCPANHLVSPHGQV